MYETIDRKLQFFSVINETQDKKNDKKYIYKVFKDLKEFETSPFGELSNNSFKRLSNNKEKSFYLKINYIDKEKANCIIAVAKKSLLPYIYKAKAENDKDRIKKINAYLDDSIINLLHFSIFFKSNIIVSESDKNIATMNQLRELIAKYINGVNFIIEPIINIRNLDNELANKEVRALEFSLPAKYIGDFSEFADVGLDNLTEITNEFKNKNTLKFTLKISCENSKEAIIGKNSNFLDKLLSHSNNVKDREDATSEKLKVTAAEDEHKKQIVYDLIEDKLFIDIEAIAQVGNQRYIDSDDMFEKIEKAYNEYKDLLF